MDKEILVGKRILAVDDEEDVLAVIREELAEADLVTASDFETAAAYLNKERFDLVILDIMGVRGFDLLELSRVKKMPAVMLTAHAMSPEAFQASVRQGAVSYLPKEELTRLSELIQEILGEIQAGRTHWPRLVQRLGPRFKELWGEMWDKIEFPDDTRISW